MWEWLKRVFYPQRTTDDVIKPWANLHRDLLQHSEDQWKEAARHRATWQKHQAQEDAKKADAIKANETANKLGQLLSID